MRGAARPVDVAVLGDLYADYIPAARVSAEGLARLRGLLPAEAPAAAGGGYVVDEATVLQAFVVLRGVRWQVAAGGRTIATAHRLAGARPDLRVGVVGVTGSDLIPDAAVAPHLAAAGVAGEHVAVLPCMSGTRLSVGAGGDADVVRLVFPGANHDLGAYLRGQERQLVAYLAGAWVHVVLPADPGLVLDLTVLVAAVRRANPATRVSLEVTATPPGGGGWAVLSDLVAVADVLLTPVDTGAGRAVDTLVRPAAGASALTCVAVGSDQVWLLRPGAPATCIHAPVGADLRTCGMAVALAAAVIGAGVDGLERISAGIHTVLATADSGAPAGVGGQLSGVDRAAGPLRGPGRADR